MLLENNWAASRPSRGLAAPAKHRPEPINARPTSDDLRRCRIVAVLPLKECAANSSVIPLYT